MTTLQLIWHEAKLEIRSGFKSGIVALTFIGLILYLLLCISNADYMQQMGAADIPRNSATLIYLMGTGCMFFQFFAWAWVFAQPILRDRKASLHEIVLSTPNSLSALLWGRFLGAAVIGAILSAAVLVGFIFGPVLIWLGIIPSGSLSPTPWGILLYAWLWLQVPVSLGIGAIYFIATLRTRSIAGAFSLAAVLMLLWMFAVVILKGSGISAELATVLDSSLFTFAYDTSETWTPAQKTSSLLPFTTASIINRVVWCLIPLLGLAWYLSSISRESLVLGSEKRAKLKGKTNQGSQSSIPTGVSAIAPQRPAEPTLAVSLRQLASETWWRLKQVVSGKGWWLGVAVLVIMGIVSSFIHVVWSADGPMAPSIELLSPLLKDALYLYIAFIVSALTGIVYRRDNVAGFKDMFFATPAPSYVSSFSLGLTVIIMTLLLVLVPGVSGATAVLLSGVGSWPILEALTYQLLVVAAPMLEIAMIALLIHALVRHAGLAYALSMLVTFILVLNHELSLVEYPPLELGITAHVQQSAVDGWAPWLDYLLTLGGFKIALGLLFAAIAALCYIRGLDSRLARGLKQIRARLLAPEGLLAAGAILALALLGSVLDRQLVDLGGYQSAQAANTVDAAWEKDAVPTASGFHIARGNLQVTIDTKAKVARGTWQLDHVITTAGSLPMELPHGFELKDATVNAAVVKPVQQHGFMSIPLNSCGEPSCAVALSWQVPLQGWSAEGDGLRISDKGIWLRADDVAPRLGLDPERFVRIGSIRESLGLPKSWPTIDPHATTALHGVAPEGRWRWEVIVDDGKSAKMIEDGQIDGPLNFAISWSPKLAAKTQQLLAEKESFDFSYDSTFASQVLPIAKDLSQMRACVHKRLGGYVPIRKVSQWPNGLGKTRVTGDQLQLAEAPHWNIADKGTGRWLRKAAIARALAAQYLTTEAGLRRVPGALWLSDGVAGAIGLLCVAEYDGIAALDQVLIRYADRTIRNLSISKIPVSTLEAAPVDDWSRYYAPMAALNWTMRQTPESIASLLAAIKAEGNIAEVLAAQEGEATAKLMLGPPLSSTLTITKTPEGGILLEGERWRWSEGGWQAVDQQIQYRFVKAAKGSGVTVEDPSAGGVRVSKALALDNWPSFPRDPKQNLIDANKEESEH